MILFTSALKVFMVQTLELDNFIQSFFCETITNFKLYIKESGYSGMQITFHEQQKYRIRGEKLIVIFYYPESYRDW